MSEIALPTFGDRLIALSKKRSRLCVGIDPHPFLLEQWGLPQSAAGVRDFSLRCVEAFGPHAALVKPQVAFYERYGSAGFAALEETFEGLRAQGALVLADAKRGDIGSTMQAYADAWLTDDAPLKADAVTISPYLGVGALKPAIERAQQNGRGVFILAATSNPEAAPVQSLNDAQGRELSQMVVDECTEVNAASLNAGASYGSVGVVVGATLGMEGTTDGRSAPELGKLNGPILLPGVGAQGAGAADIKRITSGNTELAFPTVSRSVLQNGPDVGKLTEAFVTAVNLYASEVLD